MNIIQPFNWPIDPNEITDAQYRALPGVTHSALHAAWVNPMSEYQPSEAQTFGSCFDVALLKPHLFAQQYYVLNDAIICQEIGGAKPRATNKYKDWMAEQQHLANGKIIINADEVSRINAMIMSVHKSFPWLDTSPTQVPFQGDHPILGKIKALVDIPYATHNGKNIIIDVKTCGLDQMNRPYVPLHDGGEHLLEMGYATQGEWYSQFIDETFWFGNLIVLKEPPYTAFLLVHGNILRTKAKHKLQSMILWYDRLFNGDIPTYEPLVIEV